MDNNLLDNKAIHQLKIVRGQIEGIIRMLEAGSECAPVLTQVAAAEKGLKRVAGLVLEKQIYNCATSLGDADNLEEKIQGVITAFKTFL